MLDELAVEGAVEHPSQPVAEMCAEDRLSALYAISMKRLDYRIGDATASSIVAGYSTRQTGS